MFDMANRILQLSINQGDYASYSEMMEMYQEFKSKIKSDLELGNPKTALDYELLVEGLVLENYQALQSVLGFNNYHDTTKTFTHTLDKDRTFTQKISYAIKQNKIAFQTNFDVKKSSEQSKCKIMLNGKELKQFSFIGPAGVSFYIGMYCPDYTFSVKKVQSAEAQNNYTISFQDLKKAIYRDDPVEMGLPNPYTNTQKDKHLLDKNKSKTLLLNLSNLSLETGVGIDFYLNHSEETYYRYTNSSSPILLYSSTQLNYKNFEFELDFGPVSKSTQSNPTNTVVIEKERTLFLRPIFAYNSNIYAYKKKIILNADIGVSTFFAGTKTHFLKPMAFGITAGLEPKFYLWSSAFYIGTEFAATYSFIGQAQNMIAGINLRLGADL